MNFCNINQSYFLKGFFIFMFVLGALNLSSPLSAKTINSKTTLSCNPRIEKNPGRLSPQGCGFKATLFEDNSVSINYYGEVKEAQYNEMSETHTAYFNNGSSCGLYKSALDETKWIGTCFVAKTEGYCSLDCTKD